jgi:hypothetical protein
MKRKFAVELDGGWSFLFPPPTGGLCSVSWPWLGNICLYHQMQGRNMRCPKRIQMCGGHLPADA